MWKHRDVKHRHFNRVLLVFVKEISSDESK
jgi:hypothetical protein